MSESETRVEINPTNEQIDRGVEEWIRTGQGKQKNLITCIIDETIIDQIKAIAGK